MTKRLLFTLVICLVLILTGNTLFAQSDMETVTVSISEEGVSVPESVAAGLTHFSFENSTEAPFIAILVRINSDLPPEAVLGGLFAEDTDVLSQVTFKGGPGVMPGQSTEMSIMLEAGNYLLLGINPMDFEAMPQMLSFTADDSEDAMMDAPEADVNVTMVDFGYGVPLTIDSGEKLWRIENVGEQWHELAIAPVEAGTTLDDVRDMLMQGEASGLAQFPVLMPLDSGEEAWLTIDLEPGNYVLVCNLSDIMEGAEGHLHHELGMIQLVTVEGAAEDSMGSNMAMETVLYEDPDGLFTLEYPTALAAYYNLFGEADPTFVFPNYAFSSSPEVNELSMAFEPLPEDGWGFGVLFFPRAMFAEMGLGDDASMGEIGIALNTMMMGEMAADDPAIAELLANMSAEPVMLANGTEAAQMNMPGETEDNLVMFFEPAEGVVGLVSLLTAPGARTDAQVEAWLTLVNSINFTGTAEDIAAAMAGGE